MNSTIEKFEYKRTLIKEYDYWVVLLRPTQVTFSSLVIVCKEDAESISSISSLANSEFHIVVNDVEQVLKKIFKYDKINYLALMMVDKHVHFHVLPRYSESILFNGIRYSDAHWPVAPQLSEKLDISETDFQDLKQIIASNFEY